MLPTIAGSIPHPFARPAGCPFHPRCTSAVACGTAADGVCYDHHTPELMEIEQGHSVSCHLYRSGVAVDVVAAEPVGSA
jgi:ABC-type dipeptide/oligopeptide/nickel transport system ATPase component